MDRPHRRSVAGIAAIAIALLMFGSSSTLTSLLPQGTGKHSLGTASAELVSAAHEEEEAMRLSRGAPSAAYQLAQYMIDIATGTQPAEYVTVVCPDQYMIDACHIG